MAPDSYNNSDPLPLQLRIKFVLIIFQGILLRIIMDLSENHIYSYEIGKVHQIYSNVDRREDLSYTTALASLNTATSTFLIFLGFELASLLLGISIMHLQLTFFQNFVHLFGCLFSIWFILDSWRYIHIWNLWVVFGLVPLLTEITIIIGAICFKQNTLSNLKRDSYFMKNN